MFFKVLGWLYPIHPRKTQMEITDELYNWIKETHTKCKQGNGRSCYELGSLYSTHLKGKVDKDFGRQYFRYGCDAGDGDSCLIISFQSKVDGNEEKSDRYMEKSQQCFIRQCTQKNDARSCWLYSEHILGDDNFEKYPRAVQALERGCNVGDNDCCVRAGSLLISNDYPYSNISRGIKFLETACERKDGEGCFKYAETLSEKSNSTEMFRKACKYGSEDGCIAYGLKLMEEKKAKKGLKIFTKTCEKGNGDACAIAGWILLNTHKNIEQSLSMYSKACSLGNEESCMVEQDLIQKKG